jgi:hypothetical protein
MQAASTDPLWERVVVAAVGPAVTVLVGGLVVWWITSSIQQRRDAQELRRADARADAERARAEAHEQAEKRRAEAREDAMRSRQERTRDDGLRHELVSTMSDSAASLYLMTQHYWRAKSFVKDNPSDQSGREKLEQLRSELDTRYLQSRTSGDAIEHRLSGFFISDAPRQEWHRVQDLLTVRYFQLIDRATPKLYVDNKGDKHSGLEPQEMANPKRVTDAYRAAMKKAVELVFTEALRP